MEEPLMMQVDKARVMADQAKMRIDQAKKTVKAGGDNAAIDKAAQEFEAVFLAQMMEHMFSEVDLDPMGNGPGEDIYKSLLLDEYSKLISRSGGVGVADHVKREMLRVQEGAQAAEEMLAAKEATASTASPEQGANEKVANDAQAAVASQMEEVN